MGENKEPFLKRENRFISAGLAFFIYIVLFLLMPLVPSDLKGTMLLLIHIVPVMAVFLIILGIVEKKQKEEKDRERKRKRYETTMALSKIRRQQQNRNAPPRRKQDDKPPSQ